MKRLIIPFIIILLIAVFIAAQETEAPSPNLTLSVAGETCALALIEPAPETTPEATPEPETTPEPGPESPDWLPDLPTYALSDDCENVEHLLTVPSNGTLWLALLLGDADDWLPLDTLEDDPYPPQLDGRGRYFGCAIPETGQQVCYVLVTLDDVDYLVAVPLWVGDAYFAPAPTATDEPETQGTPEPQRGDTVPAQDTSGDQQQPTATDKPWIPPTTAPTPGT